MSRPPPFDEHKMGGWSARLVMAVTCFQLYLVSKVTVLSRCAARPLSRCAPSASAEIANRKQILFCFADDYSYKRMTGKQTSTTLTTRQNLMREMIAGYTCTAPCSQRLLHDNKRQTATRQSLCLKNGAGDRGEALAHKYIFRNGRGTLGTNRHEHLDTNRPDTIMKH